MQRKPLFKTREVDPVEKFVSKTPMLDSEIYKLNLESTKEEVDRIVKTHNYSVYTLEENMIEYPQFYKTPDALKEFKPAKKPKHNIASQSVKTPKIKDLVKEKISVYNVFKMLGKRMSKQKNQTK